MKPKFHASMRGAPDEVDGLKVPYGPPKRVRPTWHRAPVPVLAVMLLVLLGAPVITSIGKIEAPATVASRRFEVRATTSGYVRRINVGLGAEVSADQVLVELADPMLREKEITLEREHAGRRGAPHGDDLMRLLAERVATQRRVLVEHQARLRATAALREQGAATVAEVDVARAQALQAEAELSSAQVDVIAARDRAWRTAGEAGSPIQAELELIDYRRQQLPQRARTAGQVLDLYVQEGEFVSPGAPLVQVGTPDEPGFLAYLEPKYARDITIGRSATIRFLDGDTARARVSEPPVLVKRTPAELAGTLGERPTSVLVKLSSDEPLPERHRLDGLPVTVRFDRARGAWWGS